MPALLDALHNLSRTYSKACKVDKVYKHLQVKDAYFCVKTRQISNLEKNALLVIQGTQENVNGDGRFGEQDEGHHVHEGHPRDPGGEQM